MPTSPSANSGPEYPPKSWNCCRLPGLLSNPVLDFLNANSNPRLRRQRLINTVGQKPPKSAPRDNGRSATATTACLLPAGRFHRCRLDDSVCAASRYGRRDQRVEDTQRRPQGPQIVMQQCTIISPSFIKLSRYIHGIGLFFIDSFFTNL